MTRTHIFATGAIQNPENPGAPNHAADTRAPDDGAARHLLPCALIAALLGGLAPCAAGPAPPAPVSLSVRADRLFLPIEVRGHRIEALLDSAAESSLIDASFAAELHLKVSGQDVLKGSGGQQEARFTKVSVRAANLDLGSLTVAVVDLSDVSRRLLGGAKVAFILGRELFDAARLRIDIEGGLLQVIDRHEPVAGAELPLREHAGLEALPVRVEGVPAAADFDLGNGSLVLIGKSFAQRSGLLDPARVVARRRGGGLGGEIERDVLRLRSLEIAGTTFHDVEAAVDSLDNAGELNVGVKVLRRFVIVTDFAQHRLWLEERPPGRTADTDTH